MRVYQIDPLTDSRWDDLVRRHPHSSIFHTRGWLQALKLTYNYEPVAFTTSAPDNELANALTFCGIYSRLSGRRLVSLPFSDHCAPLVDDPNDASTLLASLEGQFKKTKLRYIEMRPANQCTGKLAAFAEAQSFWLHTLDLRPEPHELFRNLHKDCVQRKIQRGEREGLTYEANNSEALLAKFWELLLLTRRRHRVPPQPIRWFRNLMDGLGSSLRLHVASSKDGQPVASVLTLSHRHVMVYKYSVSNPRFQSLGGTQFLLWKIILEAKREQIQQLDMGRSDRDHQGLITFKDRWHATRSPLAYWRYPAASVDAPGSSWAIEAAKRLFGHMPDGLLTAAGNLFYKHAG